MLEFKSSIDSFEDLRRQTWDCDFTLDAIEDANRRDEFMNYLQYMLNDREPIPTMTEINDFIRFETEIIFEEMGLNEDGEIPEESDEEE